jgi:predicted Holliday junction resolvase-like endonuclease
MKEFRFERSDCRSLFDPIDYIVFEGLRRKESVSKILFVGIKTGTASLTKKEKGIRNLVENKRVIWDTYKGGGK